jgi:hypothetical protein
MDIDLFVTFGNKLTMKLYRNISSCAQTKTSHKVSYTSFLSFPDTLEESWSLNVKGIQFPDSTNFLKKW